MKLLDANVLLYAANLEAEHHETARRWLRNALAGPESIVVPWICSVAYLRIATNPRAMSAPVDLSDALDFLRRLLSSPLVVSAEPDRLHLDRLGALLAATGIGGNLVNDAHLAALALQYNATVVSFDNDFSRFPGVRWEHPQARSEN